MATSSVSRSLGPHDNGQVPPNGLLGEHLFSNMKIIRLLGRGATGNIFLAKNESDQLVALKVIKKKALKRDTGTRRIALERQIGTEISHPFLVKMLFSSNTAEHLIMGFEYLGGGELFYHQSLHGVLPEVLVRFYAAELILALGYLHSRNIAYRDLKPENIMLDAEGHIRLVDFGLSKTNVDYERGARSVCGTACYVAPEVLFGSTTNEEYGLAVDWWALGVLMYEWLTGLPPWYTTNVQHMYENIRYRPLQFSPQHTVPEHAKLLISELLQKDPNHRLGAGARGFRSLQQHPFFSGLDWEMLERKEISPPYKPCPSATTVTDSTNFDPNFTSTPLAVLECSLPLELHQGGTKHQQPPQGVDTTMGGGVGVGDEENEEGGEYLDLIVEPASSADTVSAGGVRADADTFQDFDWCREDYKPWCMEAEAEAGAPTGGASLPESEPSPSIPSTPSTLPIGSSEEVCGGGTQPDDPAPASSSQDAALGSHAPPPDTSGSVSGSKSGSGSEFWSGSGDGVEDGDCDGAGSDGSAVDGPPITGVSGDGRDCTAAREETSKSDGNGNGKDVTVGVGLFEHGVVAPGQGSSGGLPNKRLQQQQAVVSPPLPHGSTCVDPRLSKRNRVSREVDATPDADAKASTDVKSVPSADAGSPLPSSNPELGAEEEGDIEAEGEAEVRAETEAEVGVEDGNGCELISPPSGGGHNSVISSMSTQPSEEASSEEDCKGDAGEERVLLGLIDPPPPACPSTCGDNLEVGRNRGESSGSDGKGGSTGSPFWESRRLMKRYPFRRKNTGVLAVTAPPTPECADNPVEGGEPHGDGGETALQSYSLMTVRKIRSIAAAVLFWRVV